MDKEEFAKDIHTAKLLQPGTHCKEDVDSSSPGLLELSKWASSFSKRGPKFMPVGPVVELAGMGMALMAAGWVQRRAEGLMAQ